MLGLREYRRGIVWVAAAACMLGACGYRLVGEGSSFPGGAKRIFVQMLNNPTSETGVETTFTNQIIFEFTRRNPAALAGSVDRADAVLSGEVASYEIATAAPRGKDAAAQRRVTMSLNLKLVGNDGRKLWSGSGITDNEVYPVSEDKLQTEQNEREAITILASRIAERVYNRLTDDF